MTCSTGCAWAYVQRADDNDPRRLSIACDQPNVLQCKDCRRTILAVCGTARDSMCQPCSLVYRGRVAIVAGSGYRHSDDDTFMLTLTAPGTVRHRVKRSGQLCPCTPMGGTDLGRWNGRAGVRFNLFITELRRALPGVKVSYLKATEVQRRGALHNHVILRFDRPPLVLRTWPDGTVVMVPLGLAWLRQLAVRFGYGHEVDFQAIQRGHAPYVAKYVAKAADERADVPWRGTRRQQGREVYNAQGEFFGWVFPDGSLEDRPRRSIFSFQPTYRTWSASGCYGDTMAAVRAAQAHWAAVVARLDPDDPGDPYVALWCPLRPDLAARPQAPPPVID